MKKTFRLQPSREWNPTSNSSFALIELFCVQWHMTRGARARSAGFLLATCLALQCFGLASTCLAQPVPRIAAYGGSALEMASSFSLAPGAEDSDEPAPPKNSIPWPACRGGAGRSQL